MSTLERITNELREIAATVEPREYAARDAARLTEVAAEAERIAAALKVLFARRAVDGNGWRGSTDAIVPEQWYSRISGCTETEAGRALKMTERLANLPATEKMLRDGGLSLTQAAICAEGAAADPTAEQSLLRIAEKGEMRHLRATKERVVTAATDEEEGRRRARKSRSFNTWTEGFSTHGSFQGPTEEVAVLLAALKPIGAEVLTKARKAKEFETHDAYRFDALVELGRRALHVDSNDAPKATQPVTRLRVSLGRLLGHESPAPGEELCEIPGVGPVPVAHAREVLPHGLLELVITDGVDVQTVVSTTRHIPKALKIALEERDQRCRVQGCDRTHLEGHHIIDFAKEQLTTYQRIGGACDLHHDLITYGGYTIGVNPDGSWTLVPPQGSAAADDEPDERQPDAA
jgi:hypothetical protein